MDELEKYLPTPPQLGPPLPGILKVYWPWVKQPPEAPKPRAVEPPSGEVKVGTPSFVDVDDGLTKAVLEHYRAEKAAKGLVPFVYE